VDGDWHSLEQAVPLQANVPETLSARLPEQLTNSQGVDLLRLMARLNSNLDEDALAQEALDAVVQLGDADGGALALVDESRLDLYVAATRGWGKPSIVGTRCSPGEGVFGWVAANLQPALLASLADQKRFPRIYAEYPEVGSLICAPLLAPSDGLRPPRTIGIICVHRFAQHPALTSNQVTPVSGLSLYIGAAFQNARLYRKLTARATQFQNMIEISRALTSSLNVDVVLRAITEKAVELLHCEAGSLLLRDEETEEMVFQVALGPVGDQLSGTRLPHGVGIVGAVMREGKPLIVNNAKTDPRHYTRVDQNTTLNTQSLLCVPLTNNNQTFGVIELVNHLDGSPFDSEDRDTLSAFAIQATIALENARLYSGLKSAFAETVRAITNALEARDPYTSGHTARVTELAIETARELGWSPEQLEILEIGALTHDIGKIGVPDAILRKPDDLTDDEYEKMKSHPVAGANMLMGIKTLEPLLPYILYHQERYDGSGYPFGLKGEEIPIEARLIAVVDAYDAMTSTRPYRAALDSDIAVTEILKHRGVQFDPNVVDAFIRVMHKHSNPIEEIE
jgi:putative nucleotidyltransferase with HDIG domain